METKKRRAPRVLVETVTRNARDHRQDFDDDVRVEALTSTSTSSATNRVSVPTDCDLPSSPRLKRNKVSSRPPKKSSVAIPVARRSTQDQAAVRVPASSMSGLPAVSSSEGRKTSRGKSLDKVSELRLEIGDLREQLAMMHAAAAREASKHDVVIDELDLAKEESSAIRERLTLKESDLHGVAMILTERERELTRQQDEADVLRAALAQEVENDEIRSRRIVELERTLRATETERDGLRSTLNQRERELTIAHDQRKRFAWKMEELVGLLHFLEIVEGRVSNVREQAVALDTASTDTTEVTEESCDVSPENGTVTDDSTAAPVE